jgi:hypothetical protein
MRDMLGKPRKRPRPPLDDDLERSLKPEQA